MKLRWFTIILSIAACAPTGHIEWVSKFGNMPLNEALAKCNYNVTAATPATCQGILGCAAEGNRHDLLWMRCMGAMGWNGVFIPDAAPGTSNYNGTSAPPSTTITTSPVAPLASYPESAKPNSSPTRQEIDFVNERINAATSCKKALYDSSIFDAIKEKSVFWGIVPAHAMIDIRKPTKDEMVIMSDYYRASSSCDDGKLESACIMLSRYTSGSDCRSLFKQKNDAYGRLVNGEISYGEFNKRIEVVASGLSLIYSVRNSSRE